MPAGMSKWCLTVAPFLFRLCLIDVWTNLPFFCNAHGLQPSFFADRPVFFFKADAI